jgi:hypothetical protein
MLRSYPCVMDMNSHKTAFDWIVGTFAPFCRVPGLWDIYNGGLCPTPQMEWMRP